ncbi:hypothetical protein CH64_1434 [Yersinia rohdei]|uniref:DUF3606 domain-containing protein n=1 Tax=Yersinia rohdei TaxID=29485 RepID=A0ABM5SFX8_YERRO|nr:hypothetical protein CH64_1434 [Yersinia rohdei]
MADSRDGKAREGGEQVSPDELTQVSDLGKRIQLTHQQVRR